MPIRTHSAAGLLMGLFLFSAHTTYAQDLSALDQISDTTCASFLAPILGRQDVARLASDRAIDVQAVCSCVKTNARADTKLTQFLLSESGAAQIKSAPTESIPSRSYLFVRVFQSVLACFSTELDKTLNASTALK